MAEKLNISFRIRAIDNFSKTMARLEGQLENLKRQANTTAIKQKVDFDIDKDGFLDKLSELEGEFGRFNDKNKVVTEFENVGFAKAVAEFVAFKKARPGNSKVKTTLEVEDKFSANIDRFKKKLDTTNRGIDKLKSAKLKIDIGGNLPNVAADLADASKALTKLTKDVDKKKKIDLDARGFMGTVKAIWSGFRGTMSKIATMSRNIGEVFQHSIVSGMLSFAPLVIPGIASVGGALGGLLPIIGTVGGAAMGLGTSFGLGMAGVGAFSALAVSSLGAVFDASSDLKDLNEDLAKATTEKERNKILEKMKEATAGLSAEQQKGLISLQLFQAEWAKISKSLQPSIITTFTTAMGGLTSLLQQTAPMFSSVATHAQNLAKWLNLQIDTADVQAFLNVLNTQVGPTFETLGKAGANFLIGIMNLMTAFTPLAMDMNKGILGMSESFRKWSSSLTASDKFQAFIKYVQENGPKLLTILGNVAMGFVGMGTAFAPFAADMMTGLVNMTQKFQEWGEALATNEGFQTFIAYVQENGPRVLSFLGEFRDFLINVGIAFAPVGEWLLKVTTRLFELANGFMEGNRTAAEIIATFGWLISVVSFLAPGVLLVRSAFQVLGPTISKVIPFVTKIGQWLAKLGPIIQKIVPWFTKIGSWVTKLGSVIMRVVPWILRIGLTIGRLGTPIGWAITAVTLIASVIIKNWDKIKQWTIDMTAKVAAKFGELAAKIKQKVELAKSAFKIFSSIDLKASGKKIIQSAIDGIASMIGKVKSTVGKVAGAIRDFFPFSPAKEGPLSDLNKLDFAGPVGDSIKKNRTAVQKAVSGLFTTPEINVQGRTTTYAARSAGYRKPQSAEDIGGAVAARLQIQTADVIMSGEKVGKVTWKTVDRNTKRNQDRKNRFNGGGAVV